MFGTLKEHGVTEVVTRRAEGVIRYGKVVELGSDPTVHVKEYAGGPRVFGVAIYDPGKGTGPTPTTGLVRQYANGDPVAVARKGIVALQAGPTSGTIRPGMRLAVLQALTVFPTLKVTATDSGAGSAPNWGTTCKIAYTCVGEWGETALIGVSDTVNCVSIDNEITITVPGQTAVPAGTTHVRIYVSKDDGATWANWLAGDIAYASLTAGPTHSLNASGANQALGTRVPPATSPTMPAIGDILRSNDTRNVLVISGTEIIKGGTAGEEIWVQLNLPA